MLRGGAAGFCDRRAFLAGCGALGGLALVGPVSAAVAPAERLTFDILRDGTPIGRHTVAFRRDGARLEVEVAIDIEVALAFLTLFRYRHRNREIWQDGRLIDLETETDDDGTRHRVRARAEAGGLRVEAGPENGAELFRAPPDILPTSYWHPQTPSQTRLLDTQSGRVLAVAIEPRGREAVAFAGAQIPARRYAVSGDLTLDLWYTAEGRWLKAAFAARGAKVAYRPAAWIGDGSAAGTQR